MPGDQFFVPVISKGDQEVRSALALIESTAIRFGKFYGIHVELSVITGKDIIHLYTRELKKLNLDHKKGPNIYKRTAAMASWIMRLKPIYGLFFAKDTIFNSEARKNFALRHINEIFAMYYCFVQISKARPKIIKLQNTICNTIVPGQPPFDEFLSNLRYRFLGVRQLATLLQLCCENALPNDHLTP